MRRFNSLLTVLLLVWSGALYSAVNELQLRDEASVLVAGRSMQWWADESNQHSIYTLLTSDSVDWVDSTEDVPNLGYRMHPVWFRLPVTSDAQESLWNFVIDYPLILELDIFFVEHGEVSDIYQLGERFEFASRPVLHRNFIVPFELSQGNGLEIYIRVNGPYAVQMPARIMSAKALLEYEVLSVMAHGLFFGFVLVMGFYNLFLYLSTRESTYIYYVIFTFFIGLFQFVEQGFAYQFLWPKEVWWQNKATGVLLHACLISSYLFVNRFLNLRRNMPWVLKLYSILCVLSLLTLCAVPFMDEFWTIRFGVILVIPCTMLAVFGGWIAWMKGQREARFFSIAWFAFLMGALLLALNKLGWIPRNTLTEHAAEAGTVVELALLAFALAGRIKQERLQRQELEFHAREMERAALIAKEHALELEKMNSEQLERNVRERTRDLHKALSELSQMNRRLEQLNQVDAVTGVGNENSFLSNLSKEWDRSYREGEVLSLIVVELDNYREIHADYGAVASDECLKNVASILERLISRPADCITRYGDKVFGIVLPGTDEKGAQHLADKIVNAVAEQPFDFGVAQVKASVSVGVAAVMPFKPDQYRELLMSAEGAVYVAKNDGGNRVKFATIS